MTLTEKEKTVLVAVVESEFNDLPYTNPVWLEMVSDDTFKGKVFDSETKEPIVGAMVQLLSNPQMGTTSNAEGKFSIATNSQSDSLKISFIGYTPLVKIASENMVIALTPNAQELQSVIVTANREASLRTQSPMAISKLSPKLIDESKDVIYEAGKLIIDLEHKFIDKMFEMGDLENLKKDDLKHFITKRTNEKLGELGYNPMPGGDDYFEFDENDSVYVVKSTTILGDISIRSSVPSSFALFVVTSASSCTENLIARID